MSILEKHNAGNFKISIYITLFMATALSIGFGLFIAKVNPRLMLDYSPAEAKKWIALGCLFVLFIFSTVILKNGVRAFILLLPPIISFSYVLLTFFVSYNQYFYNNIFGYHPWILVYEPFIVVIGGTLVFLGRRKTRKQNSWIVSPLLPYLMLLFSGLFSMLFYARDTTYSWIGLFALTKFLIWIIIFIPLFTDDITHVKPLALGFACLVIFQSIIGIMQAFQLPIFGSLVDWSSESFITRYGVTRVGGTIGRSNLEAVLLLVLPVLLSYVIYNRLSNKRGVLIFLSILLGTITVFLTGTRGPIIALMVGLIATLFIWRKKNAKIVMKISLIIFVFFLLGVFIFLYMGDTKDTLLRTTYLVRIESFKVGFRMFIASPFFGIGLNNYLITGSSFGISLREIKIGHTLHNQYILFLAETGGIGLIAYLLFLISSFKFTFMAISYCEESNSLIWFPIGVLGSLVSLLVIMFTDKPLVNEPVVLILALQIAAVISLSNKRTHTTFLNK